MGLFVPAIDKCGHMIDFYLSPTRNTQVAKWFLGKALKSVKSWAYPRTLNTDKAPAYSATITELKTERTCPPDTVHRQAKYLNNMIEDDHGKLKRLINPVRSFKSMKTAYAKRLRDLSSCICSRKDRWIHGNTDEVS